MQNKRVIVGLSGGVDSSVAAYLLQQQGYEVIGLFMKNWHDDSVTISDDCPWLEDSNDAMLVAEKLGIPFQTVDLSVQYKERIVDYMFAEYQRGRTPNPDVLCNREIKFDVFLDIALSLGADYVATGHYCQKDSLVVDAEPAEATHRLLAGADPNKDQSYFLCQLNQAQLAKTLFPIGGLQKSEVRNIAAEQELVTAEKRDSQGLCFVGKVSLPDFLQQKLATKKGAIIQVADTHPMYAKTPDNTPVGLAEKFVYTPEDGNVVGTHNGAHFFTVGQRKGLAVGGTKEPLFVLATDVQKNSIYVGEGKDHPGLYRTALWIDQADVHWIRPDLETDQPMKVAARIRYRQPLATATLHPTAAGMYLVFDAPQSAIAAGQFAAWYLDNELIGSGVIG
ncbi:MAG: tRNA 2-thiouridine(34) synthase MnmA [Flavobacteriaceae bacterium]|jgi:tRNA-specific 2-thiouridylase|nr:tRNA 2-thiouridine(34) synthase MnmA [Flavobacteriaceae bacterium]MDG2289936.1 tRNA 2-thiouridine(34) synthase MnmA [Flavobacteriaceae bacterium]